MSKTRPHMIRPFHLWLRDVERAHDILDLGSPRLGSRFWHGAYRNNESPIQAICSNLEWTEDAAWCRRALERWLEDHPMGDWEFFNCPYDGIGDDGPYIPFEP